MALSDRLKSLVKQFAPPTRESPWQPHGQPYPMLAQFDPAAAGLAGQPGLLAIWHLGVRPQWLKVAAATDLARVAQSAAACAPIVFYKPNGGVYLAWTVVKPPALLGHARHVVADLKPTLQPIMLDGELPVPEAAPPLAFPPPPGTGEG